MPIPITPAQRSQTRCRKRRRCIAVCLSPGWHNGASPRSCPAGSEAGNNMLVACIVVTDPEGNEHELRHYILIDLPAPVR